MKFGTSMRYGFSEAAELSRSTSEQVQDADGTEIGNCDICDTLLGFWKHDFSAITKAAAVYHAVDCT